MKIKTYVLIILLALGVNFLWAQHENDNWMFGNNKWNFNTTSPNGFTHTTNINPNIRYNASVVSDKNTGELLFYCNGYKIYNKNNLVMANGDQLFGSANTPNQYEVLGNPSDQSSIIVPVPNSRTLYYVFYINGDRIMNDQLFVNAITPPTKYGLRYAIVDMSLNAGLGGVTSKNNILFTNSDTNALTSTFANDGNSYWIVTANNSNFLSYKLDSNGLNSTPMMSSGANYGGFIRISPNAKKLVTRQNSNVFLYDFNNVTGSVTNPFNIIPNNSATTYYADNSGGLNSAEFSPDSNIIYFISSRANLCTYPTCIYNISGSGLSMYNISTGSLVGVLGSGPNYQFSLDGLIGGIQRAQNGKIYLMYNAKLNDTSGAGYKEVIFGTYNPSTGTYTSFNWGVINTPDTWSPTTNPLSSLTPQSGTMNGFSFPQLIPSLENVNTCPDNLNINNQVTSSQNFQAGQHIVASSIINDGLIVNYKAGIDVRLITGFHVKAVEAGIFRAYISPCTVTQNFARTSSFYENFSKQEITSSPSDVKVYPNPARDYISINPGKEKMISWEMYDMSGKFIAKGNSNTISVQNIIKGNYLLKIILEKTQISKTIIVK
ncbi:T9SS type A sorting domain-containing protein [Chryseobacterium hispalense]|uniref:T9SS type A sorting domain-containing protein n=1 Tax=Chryseobacterium hispalense TaxID=1453492 RepID=UPI00391D685B